MRQRIFRQLAVLFALLVLAGCKTKQAEPVAAPEPEPAGAEAQTAPPENSNVASAEEEEVVYNVGFILTTREEDAYNQIGEAIMEKAQEVGIQAVISDGEADATIQSNHIENFAAMGYDAIAIAAVDEAAVAPTMAAATAAGIPVFTFGTPCYSLQQSVCYVGTNDKNGGRMGAEEAIRRTEYGEIALITSSEAIESIDREQGFRAAVDSQSDVECVAFGDCEGNEQKAYDLVQNWLATHPELGAVFCTKDVAAAGALRAIKEAEAKTCVIGFDGTMKALVAVADAQGDGMHWVAEVTPDTKKIGAVLTEQIKKYLDGGQTNGRELLIDPILNNYESLAENGLIAN